MPKLFFFVLICQQIAFVIRMNIQWFILFWCVNKTDERNEYTKLPCIVHLIYRHTDFIVAWPHLNIVRANLFIFDSANTFIRLFQEKKIFFFRIASQVLYDAIHFN